MKHQGGQGTFGGLATAERAVTSDEAEKSENLNLRNPDLLDDVLSKVLGRATGGFQTNKTFVTQHEYTRPTDITYDRFYYQENLLVHFFANTKAQYTDHDSVQKEVDEMRKFAYQNHYKFLPIIAGSITPDDLNKALK